MTQVDVLNVQGDKVDSIDLPTGIFESKINIGLMHQAYLRQMANARQGTSSTLRRGEVRASTRKIYRQKGTGRARHGAISAPIFVGGGIAFGPKPRDYTQKMPKKMRRGAIRSALSAIARDNQLIVVDRLEMDAPRTKEIKQTLNALTGGENALVLFTRGNVNVQASVNNLPKAQALLVNNLNVRDLLKYDKVILPLDALEVIKEIWGTER